jgi:surface polysaccharide O-acyltransferase-like enzyme
MQDQNILDTGSNRPLSEEARAQLYQLQFDLSLADNAIRNGMMLLYVVGGFSTVLGLFRLIQDPEDLDLEAFEIQGVLSATLGIFFLLLGVLARRYPVPVFALATGVYALLSLANLAADFSGALLGSIIRVVIIIAWVRAFRAATSRNAVERQAATYAVTLDALRAME